MPGKKTGVYGICKCSKTGAANNPYPAQSCSLTFAGKALGRYSSMAKKSTCYEGTMTLNEEGSTYSKTDAQTCCAGNPCTDVNAICTDIEVNADNFYSEKGFACTCLDQYFDNSEAKGEFLSWA